MIFFWKKRKKKDVPPLIRVEVSNVSYKPVEREGKKKIRIVGVREWKRDKIEVRKVKELVVFYDKEYGKIARFAVSKFIHEIHAKIDVKYKKIDPNFKYGEGIDIRKLYDWFVVRNGLNKLEYKVLYFTRVYPIGVNEFYRHATAAYGNLAVISIYGIENFVRGLKLEEALIWLTLHEIGHTFGLQHHGWCAMDPLHAHYNYCNRCKNYIRGLIM